jgi:hypothetical protein
MKLSRIDVPADDRPRDVSRPALRPRRLTGARMPGYFPTPESDSRTHQRFSEEGESLAERERLHHR